MLTVSSNKILADPTSKRRQNRPQTFTVGRPQDTKNGARKGPIHQITCDGQSLTWEDRGVDDENICDKISHEMKLGPGQVDNEGETNRGNPGIVEPAR